MFTSEADKRLFLRKQRLEVHLAVQGAKVTCAGCRRRVLVRQAYRCFICRLWFCWTCSKQHFTKSDIR